MERVNSRGIGGWLLVLCTLLFVWQPVELALVASDLADAVAIRGLSAELLFAARVIVTVFGVAAAVALAGRRPGAVAMAKASLVASAATDVFVLTTPYFPSNRAPGDTPLYVAASLAYYTGWLIYLFRSRRVRNTFHDV